MTTILQPRLFLVVLAGGQSTRARRSDSAAPKQFRDVGGSPLFVHALRTFAAAPGVSRAIVVVPGPWRPTAEQALDEAALPYPCGLAAAGRHRTASAWSALRVLAALPRGEGPEPADLVAVHDAARPFASHHLLARVARAAARRGAAVPAVPVPDTVVQLDAGRDDGGGDDGSGGDGSGGDGSGGSGGDGDLAERPVAQYLERHLLAAVQTPQVARWSDLHAAHARAADGGLSFTDDGGLLAANGIAPVVVMGEPGNWKITTEQDWERAVALLRRAVV